MGVGIAIRETHDDETEGRERFVDVLGLVQHRPVGSCLGHLLRPSKIDKIPDAQ